MAPVLYLIDSQWFVWSFLPSGWWFQSFFIFIPTWGNDRIWLIFFRWVETTKVAMHFIIMPSCPPFSVFLCVFWCPFFFLNKIRQKKTRESVHKLQAELHGFPKVFFFCTAPSVLGSKLPFVPCVIVGVYIYIYHYEDSLLMVGWPSFFVANYANQSWTVWLQGFFFFLRWMKIAMITPPVNCFINPLNAGEITQRSIEHIVPHFATQ